MTADSPQTAAELGDSKPARFSDAAGSVRIRLLGGFEVSIGSRVIREDEWRLRKAASLVKLLALAPDHRLHREQIMDLLWHGDYAFDDTIRGGDTLSGNGGADSLRGGPGRDKLYGGSANDTVNAVDGVRDRVIDCGRGTEDTVFFDPEDGPVVNINCEIHNPSEVEPPPGPG